MTVPESPASRPGFRWPAVDERAAALRGLRLLTVAAAVVALVFSLLLAGTGSTPASTWTPATTPVALPLREASGSLAVNALSADDLAAQLPGIGPVYAERIVYARTFFGPLRSAADLRALDIPNATIDRLLPLISFRA